MFNVGFGGFISSTCVIPPRKTTIDYYTPITQYETVQELLECSEEATKAVGQKHTINTFDLGVCMEVQNPYCFYWTIPHQHELYWNAQLTNVDSGYAEILLEAQLV